MLEGRKTVITASIGMASSTASRTVAADDLLREADAAMYHAKRSGKNTCVVFDPSMHATALARLELQADLALARGSRGVLPELPALLRPGRRTARRVRGADSLEPSRPRPGVAGRVHPSGRGDRSHPPDRRLGTPRGVPTGTAVAAGIGRDGAPTVNVNVSALQIQEPGLVGKVAAALRVTGLDPRQLVLEITEGVLLRRDRSDRGRAAGAAERSASASPSTTSAPATRP